MNAAVNDAGLGAYSRPCDKCGATGVALRWAGFFERTDMGMRVVKRFICRSCEGPAHPDDEPKKAA